MNIADTIKQARERRGMTQEELAEKLEVSRQAVSKWELGASLPSPENLNLLEEVLGVSFPAPEEPSPQEKAPPSPEIPKAAFWNWKRAVLLALGVLVLLAVISCWVFTALVANSHTNVARRQDPYVTDIAFYDEDANPLRPDLGDGWYSFAPDQRVLMVVEFQPGWSADAGSPVSADAVSLFLTPTGTETFDQRQQWGVQAVPDGRCFALFALHIPRDLMGHLDIMLESGGTQTVAETLNITANPDMTPMFARTVGLITLSPVDLTIQVGDIFSTVLSVEGAPPEEVAWISADPDIAGVSTTGMVWGVSPGVTTVTAEWNGQTAECVVRVGSLGEAGNTDLDNPDLVYMPESGISYEPETLTIPSGAALFMDEPYLLLRSSGVPEDEIVWTSSNPAVVEVSDIGALFPVSPGTAVVTARWKDQTAECQVEVFTETVPTDVPGVSKAVQ